MSLLEDCEENFKTKDLYELFRIEKTASASAVKKAYYKLSMICHPDKVEDKGDAKSQATVRFQLVSKVYAILSDKDKRKIYDETGSVCDEDIISDEDSVKLWRKVFKKVTKEDIDKFFEEYKGSKEEEDDIIAIYNKCEGNMDLMLQFIMLHSSDDETRVKEIIDRLIKEGSLTATKKYKSSTSKAKTTSRAKKAAKEAKEAEEMLKEIQQKEGTGSLEEMILSRRKAQGNKMMDLADSLAAKYAPKSKKLKK